MEIEKKVDAVAKAFEDFKVQNQKSIDEMKTKGFELAETKAALEKANAEIDRLSDEVKKVHTALNRGDSPNDGSESAEMAAYKAGFNKFLRKGSDEGLAGLQAKALSVGSDVDGGYLVLPEMSSEIVKKIFESSPVRQLASVQQISSDTLEIIQDLDEAAASWVTEAQTRPATSTPQLKKIVISVHEMSAKPLATQKILDDAMFNPEAWLAEKVSDNFRRTEANAFVVGDGVNKPRGFLSYAAGTGFEQVEQINSGSAATIADANGQADGLINCFMALKADYKSGAAWMMKRATVASVRKLKDGNDMYIWQPALTAGNPDMLFGYPVYEADDFAAEGAGNLVAAFGNFKAGYQIADRFGIRVLRDPFSSKPYIEFYTTKRVGGGVKNFEAIKILKCST